MKKLFLIAFCLVTISISAMDLYDAVQRRDYAQVNTLLAQGSCIDGEQHRVSPLILAIDSGDLAMAAFLMGRGARLYPLDPIERDAVSWAWETGNQDMITLVTLKNAQICKEIFRNGRSIEEALEHRERFGTW